MENKCEKCGSESFSKRFIPYRSLINSSSTKKVSNEFIDCSEYDFFYKLTAGKDHLLLKCEECGFTERVNCIDTKDKE
jgi:uncharacterized Zn finger protein